MRARIGVLWLPTATRTAVAFATALLGIVVVIGLAQQPWRGWDLGTATQNLARVHAVVIPVTIGWSAYAALDLAHRPGWRRAQRSPRAEVAWLGQLLRAVLPPVLGYLGAALVLGLFGLAVHALGDPRPFWLASAVVAVIAAAVGGAALGTVLARWRSQLRWVIPGVLAVAVYAGFLPLVIFTTSQTQWLRSLYPIVYDTALPYDVLNSATLLGRVLWFGGVAAAIAAVLFLGRAARIGVARPGVLALAVVGIGCAMLGAMTLRSTAGLLVAGVDEPERRCHTGDGVQVCLFPNRDADADALLPAFGDLHARTSESALVLRRFVQLGADTGALAADETGFTLAGYGDGFEADAVESAVHAHFGDVQCGSPEAEAYRGIVLDWLSGRDVPPMLDEERAFAALSEAEKRVWFGDHLAEVEGCTLTADSFAPSEGPAHSGGPARSGGPAPSEGPAHSGG